MNNLVGQGYDDASVMSSSRNGVQAKVAAKCPNAVYVHCRSHVLNLAIAGGCKSVRLVRNLFDDFTKLTQFCFFWGGGVRAVLKGRKFFLMWQLLMNSSKSEELSHLVDIGGGELRMDEAEKALQQGGGRLTVPKFCPMRWSARVTTLSALMARSI